MGASCRHSASFWWVLRGTRRVSRVAVQLASAWALPASGGNVQIPPFVLGAIFLQRRGAHQLQGAGQCVAERFGRELHPASRPFQQPAASFDLRLEVFLPLASRFELLGRDTLLLPVEIRRFDLAREALRVPVTDSATKAPLDIIVDHLGKTAELALDGLGLLHQDFEDAVLLALREHEVVTTHCRRRLKLAVDSPVALLDATRIPGQVEVEEIGAVRLEVQPLAGSIGGEQNPQRVACGVGVEPALDLLALRTDGLPVDGLDAFVGKLGAGDGLFEHLAQKPLRADDVLREDQHSALVPARRRRCGKLVGQGRAGMS